MTWEIRQGHVLDVLKAMPAESVHCCITSPPYWGLRAYGTEPQVWGGDLECPHNWRDEDPAAINPGRHSPTTGVGEYGQVGDGLVKQAITPASTCLSCGAWRGELGSEPTIALFIAHLMQVFDEVRRVLRSDGTCWVNLGDSYAGSGKGPGGEKQLTNAGSEGGRRNNGQFQTTEVKPKDLCLIPERFALAMQDAGWWVRSRIAWAKTSAMPESVTDRPTSAWEHIWLFSKSARYYYDAAAVREPNSAITIERHQGKPARISNTAINSDPAACPPGVNRLHQGSLNVNGDDGRLNGANQRNYWLLGPDPYPESHFATFPREIPKRCILAGSPLGGTVLDPFVGSGTTLFVAEEQGRDSIGIELQPEYVKLAEKRMRSARTPLPGLLS